MRRRMETRSQTRSSEFFDVKLGSGGLVDVEFIAQMVQLKLGGQEVSLRFLPTSDVLVNAPADVVSHQQSVFLKKAYELYRRLELMMRLVLDEHSTVLPMDQKLELLAAVLGFSRTEELLDLVRQDMKSVRSHFLQIVRTLSTLE